MNEEFIARIEEKDLKHKVHYKSKSCPFCGGEAECSDSSCTVNGEFKWTVECLNCGVMTSPFETKEDAIKAWNRRKEE